MEEEQKEMLKITLFFNNNELNLWNRAMKKKNHIK